MATYAATMARLNEKLLTTFPDTVWHRGVEYPCIAPPIELFKQLTKSTYDDKATFTFQMLEATRATAGIGLRDTLFFDSHYTRQISKGAMLAFEVYAFTADKNDSMVMIRCNIQQ